MMTLLLALDPSVFPQVSRGRSVRVVHKLIRYATIPEVELKPDLCANMFDVVNGLGTLQDDQLKAITRLEFHFRAHIPSSSAERVEKKISRFFRTVHCSVG